MRRIIASAALAASLLGLVGGNAVSASAATQSGGCPAKSSGWQVWPTSAEPYQADNAADLNGDQVVCARPTKDTFEQDGVVYRIYFFNDNRVRAA